MLNFHFLDKGLGIVSPAHFVYMIFQQNSSCYFLLTDQILLPFCHYFLRYWVIYVLQLFVNQVVTSWILKLTYLPNQLFFSTWPNSHDKNLNIFRTGGAFKWNKKHFSSFLKGFQLSKIVSDLRVHL